MSDNSNILKKTSVVCGLALVCCALWGSAFPGIKLGYAWMEIEGTDTAAQLLFAGCRFFLAGILTIIIGSLIQGKLLLPQKGSAKNITMLAAIQTFTQYIFFYIGIAHTTGVKASIIESMNVFAAVLLACFLFKQENITVQKIVGCLLGFMGVVLINLNGGSMDFHFTLIGEGFMFISTIAYACSSALMKEYGKRFDPVTLSGYQFLVGGGALTIVGLFMGGRFKTMPIMAIGMLLWLSFVSAAAYSIWGILLKYNPVSKVTVFGFSNPIFGVIFSAILLKEGETLGLLALISLILASTGILIVNYKNH